MRKAEGPAAACTGRAGAHESGTGTPPSRQVPVRKDGAGRVRLAVCVALVALLGAVPATAQERREVPDTVRYYGEPASEADRAAIDTLLEEYRSTWARHDARAWIALHAADTEWINAYARLFQGAEPLAEFAEQRLFPAFDASVSSRESAAMRLISVRYLGDDAAVLHLYTDSPRGSSRNAGEDLRRTHLHLVLAKTGDAWRIVHTAIMDAR